MKGDLILNFKDISADYFLPLYTWWQIGGSLTSKRISQFLESCAPIPYILVDSHPYRHDPSHIVTYRIQSDVPEFVATMLEFQFSNKAKKWTCLLKEINSAVWGSIPRVGIHQNKKKKEKKRLILLMVLRM